MAVKKKYKTEIDREKCKGCGLCIAFCPKKVLKLSEDRETNEKGYQFARVVKQENCTGCANCAIICPDVCIEIRKEVLCGREKIRDRN